MTAYVMKHASIMHAPTQVRDEELPELDELVRSACAYEVRGGPENKHGKVNVLLQARARARFVCESCIVSIWL